MKISDLKLGDYILWKRNDLKIRGTVVGIEAECIVATEVGTNIVWRITEDEIIGKQKEVFTGSKTDKEAQEIIDFIELNIIGLFDKEKDLLADKLREYSIIK